MQTVPPCKIGTHNGAFHCDETLSCVFLTQFTQKYKNSTIIRTRDQTKLNSCDIVVDVGQVYDPALFRFDHHQNTFNEEYEKGNGVRMSSAGLVFKHFGNEIVQNVIKTLGEERQESNMQYSEDAIEQFQKEFYKSFVQAIDAKDNGIHQWPQENSELQPLYYDKTTLSTRIAMLNLNWKEQTQFPDVAQLEEKSMERFYKAMDLVKQYVLEYMYDMVFVNYPAQVVVEQAFKEKKLPQIIVFSTGCPFQSCFHSIEEKLNQGQPPILYVIYQNATSGHYYVQAVAQKKGSFSLRKPLKKEWNGQSQEELVKLTGIKDIVFCHRSGFLGGAESLESTIKMAELSIEAKE